MDTPVFKLCVVVVVALFVQGCVSQGSSPQRQENRERDLMLQSMLASPAMSARVSRARGLPRVQTTRVAVTRGARVPVNSRQSSSARSTLGQTVPNTIRQLGTRGFMSSTSGRPLVTLQRSRALSSPQRRLQIQGSPGRSLQLQRPTLVPVASPNCGLSRIAACREIPVGRTVRVRTTRCYKNCPGRACVVRCVCACVSRARRTNSRQSLISRLSSGNPGSFRLQNTVQVQRTGPRDTRRRQGNRARSPSVLTFGLSESALASILANPDVSSLVGPQGINDILAGEPPPIMSRDVRPGGASMQGQLVPRMRPVGQQGPPTVMGIPIPLQGAGLGMGQGTGLGAGQAAGLGTGLGNGLGTGLGAGLGAGQGTGLGGGLGNDLMLAGLLASSGDLMEEMAGLQMRVPAVRGSKAPALDLVMPSAIIDNSVLVQSTSAIDNRTSPTKSGLGTTSIIAPGTMTGLRANLPSNSGNITSLPQNRMVQDLRQFMPGFGPNVPANSGNITSLLPNQIVPDMSQLFSALAATMPINNRTITSLPQNQMIPDMRQFFTALGANPPPTNNRNITSLPRTPMSPAFRHFLADLASNMPDNEMNSLPQSQMVPDMRQFFAALAATAPTSNRNITSLPQNQILPDMRQFLTGTVRSTDPRMIGPSKDECQMRRLELWCDPAGVWRETPGVARWCLLNCRADNCDRKRCSCKCIDEAIFKQRYELVE